MDIRKKDTIVIFGDYVTAKVIGGPSYWESTRIGPIFEGVPHGEVFTVHNSDEDGVLVMRGENYLVVSEKDVVLVERHKPSYRYTVCDMYRDVLQITDIFTEALTYCDNNPDTMYITRFDNDTAKTREWKKDKNGMFYQDVLAEGV